MKRDLDDVYFPVNRDGKCHVLCFSDLTDAEMDEVLKGKSKDWLKRMCKILGKTLKDVGDMFNIISE